MVQNNKVLTVSYGTFSCTLEGFEDSFDTMKAIAEYFRDLASDDRYFGAEPPQPDAEMLTRIAQREVDRQVEARTSDGAVHLRAADPIPDTVASPTPPRETVEPPVAAPAAPPAIEQNAEVAEPESVEPEVAAESSPTPVDTPVIAEPAAAVIEATDEAFVAVDETPAPADQQQDDSVDLSAIAAAVATPDVAELPPVEDIVATDVEATQTEAGDDTTPAVDSIAAKLQRIRAVVAQAPRQGEFSEDEHAEIFINESAVDIAAAMRADDEAQLAEDDESHEQPEIDEALSRIDQRRVASFADQPKATVEPEAEIEVAVEPETVSEVEAADEADVTAEAEIEPEAEVDVVVETVAEPNVSVDEDSSIFDGLEDTPESSETNDTDHTDHTDEEANILAEVTKQAEISTSETEAPAAVTPTRARIVRVKRADLERAVESGALEEIEAEAPQEVQQETPDSSLSDADEADLLRELASVEAELLATSETTTEQPDMVAETQPAASAVSRPPVKSPDSDVSRLMDAADEKLEDPETSSSRETYDHLRAAMAAAQADRAAGGSVGSDARDDEYREDLASVVRPRRPAASRTASRRPETVQRPAPLKLVAEQRIDEAPVKKSGPVRPRRVAASQTDEAEFAGKGREGGFAEYASESGALELHELLEAAASYMSFVEGRDHFSRPQLMNKVKLLDSAEFNREDGLRSFGLLLREGKIEKTHNGRFTASGQIGFRPGQRAAG
ncbi:chemotaxis protein CheA [Parasedimentitalea marina]|uniref:Chemotaxis protein CheA n=2 Tax=Parasedimentitalea marina TaxID=2483033 RepID=A0A3T0N516_9RHOB|nr:chemotaxis protein CheA [Parasedimentitalea marina]AZV79130.1 chemotaxis protein CheA [Parasedimentitalea marina]